jgi:hypothetical protein
MGETRENIIAKLLPPCNSSSISRLPKCCDVRTSAHGGRELGLCMVLQARGLMSASARNESQPFLIIRTVPY